MAFFVLTVNLFWFIIIVRLYVYLYAGKEKAVKKEKSFLFREIMAGIIDGMKQQHLDGKKID